MKDKGESMVMFELIFGHQKEWGRGGWSGPVVNLQVCEVSATKCQFEIAMLFKEQFKLKLKKVRMGSRGSVPVRIHLRRHKHICEGTSFEKLD